MSAIAFLPLSDQAAIFAFIAQTKLTCGSELQSIILYGSKARNDAGAESDIDLLLIMNRNDWQLRHTLSNIASRISLAHNVTISVQIVSQQRWQQMKQAAFLFFSNVFREGIPLLDPGHLFQDVPTYENVFTA